MVWRLRYC